MNRSGENPAIFPATIFPQSISCPVRTEETHEPVMTCDRGSKLGKLKCGGRKPPSYIYGYTVWYIRYLCISVYQIYGYIYVCLYIIYIYTQTLHVWYIYLQNWVMFGVNVDQCSIHVASRILHVCIYSIISMGISGS